MRNNNQLIYKAPLLNGFVDIILAIFLFGIILYIGIVRWEFSLVILVGVFLFLRNFYRVKIFEQGIFLKIILNKDREIKYEDCILFENNNGRVSNHFAINYKKGKNIKSIKFYIKEKKDVEMLVEFLKSKGVKVTVVIPRF